MKNLKNLVKGFVALSIIILFSQCANKSAVETAGAGAQNGVANLKVAYVEIDTLLAKYNFCIDLNEAMVKKSENVRLTINQKAADLEKQKQEFQTKYQNNLKKLYPF